MLQTGDTMAYLCLIQSRPRTRGFKPKTASSPANPTHPDAPKIPWLPDHRPQTIGHKPKAGPSKVTEGGMSATGGRRADALHQMQKFRGFKKILAPLVIPAVLPSVIPASF